VNEDNVIFADERRSRILELLEKHHRVAVSDLASRFEVSDDTIRRDLRHLTARGLIRKTYGGALRLMASMDSYDKRLSQGTDLKAAIGARAAELVQEGDTVILDSGTTTLWVARSLRVAKVRVLTNDLEVAKVIAQKPGSDLIVLGGRWDAHHRELVGPATVEQILRYRVDKAFLGMAAIDRKQSWTDVSEEDASVKRAMIQVAEQVIGVADHTKLGKVAFSWVAEASVIDILVTDLRADTSSFDDLGWEIIRADVGRTQS
jgi:DeoR/GlpR family transcriptional regulator of sugar metabolism